MKGDSATNNRSLLRSTRNTGVPSEAILRSVVLIRLLVGWVFVSEGVQKFLFPANLGVGRFLRIGIRFPHLTAPSFALVIDMLVAIATTEIHMLIQGGIWKMAHESRVNFSMLLGLLFRLIVGPGGWSLEALFRKHGPRPGP